MMVQKAGFEPARVAFACFREGTMGFLDDVVGM
jgi:hypothetical protein